MIKVTDFLKKVTQLLQDFRTRSNFYDNFSECRIQHGECTKRPNMSTNVINYVIVMVHACGIACNLMIKHMKIVTFDI